MVDPLSSKPGTRVADRDRGRMKISCADAQPVKPSGLFLGAPAPSEREPRTDFRFLQYGTAPHGLSWRPFTTRNAYASMIVLTTPTGNIGSKVLRGLLTSSEPVRLIARDPAKLPPDLPATVEIVPGRTDVPETLRRALKGADAFFWCQPDTPTSAHYVKAYDD